LNAPGPDEDFRYVADPGNPKAVLDMRHFLVIGEQGELVGLLVETLQIPSKSAWDPQDFHSNVVGAEFFKPKNYNPQKPFGDQLRKFFNKRKRILK